MMRVFRFLALVFLILFFAACRSNQRPNLIIITIDTLRADHMSLYGYVRNTTPNLDAFAKENSWFTRCYSQSAVTLSSHTSLFTSRYPESHGVLGNLGHFPMFPSMMDVFRGNGYYAAGFVSSPVLAKKTALPEEFDYFDSNLTRKRIGNIHKEKFERPAEDTIQSAEKWITSFKQNKPGTPLLLWIHLIDPHGPYDPPENKELYYHDALFQQNNQPLNPGDKTYVFYEIPSYQFVENERDSAFYVARYDAEIHYADKALGGFFRYLKANNLYNSSVLIVTADHGETMTEHKRYFSHGVVAYEEDVRVPLIAKDVQGKNRFASITQNSLIRLIDLTPTLCSLFGWKAPATFQGKDLFHSKNSDGESIYSFGNYAPDYKNDIGTQFTVLKSSVRYVKNIPDGTEELYDHSSDPKESKDIAQHDPKRLEMMRKQLDLFFASVPRAVPSHSRKLTREEEEQMKSLGYVN